LHKNFSLHVYKKTPTIICELKYIVRKIFIPPYWAVIPHIMILSLQRRVVKGCP